MFSFGIAVVILIFLGVLALSIIIERVINLLKTQIFPKTYMMLLNLTILT